MALTIECQDTKFRVVGQELETNWLEDTYENRKVLVIFLYLLQDKEGRGIFTLQELAEIIGSPNRQAASKYIERFRKSGEDIHKTLHENSRADQEVREVIWEIVLQDPLINYKEIAQKANEQMGRDDISENHVAHALGEIDYGQVRARIKKLLEKGTYHYKEQELIDMLFDWVLNGLQGKVVLPIGLESSVEALAPERTWEQEEQVKEAQDRAETKRLFDEQTKVENLYSIWQTPLGWYLWIFILYYQGVSTAAIGRWLGVNKSTISRRLLTVALWAQDWMEKTVEFSGRVSVDEKMIKIGACYWLLFVAVDCVTGYPLHIAVYSSNSTNYCTLFLAGLKAKGYLPTVIITDGWDGYIKSIAKAFPNAQHLLCRFHVIRSIFRRLRKHHIFDWGIRTKVGKLFKTKYKRTVLRRIEKLKTLLGLPLIEAVLGGLMVKLPQVIKAVGSRWRPSTSNAVEQFFSKFDRFYRLKGPFQNEASAQKHIRLFMLGYLFSIAANGQACPLEKARQDVARVPFYHLINQPNIMALKERMAQQYQKAG